ncbi:hypothetical protein A3A20_00360 [Candidatus Wolfebacteria bacterium RIFCSPLOWO2_01_FULL_45_19]|uniref:Uncharacterized protein n=1 Tax=Candidatus Wolfebacteria bacterium RIFCSPLOWO2_01_FULL_45_19 TaxID=1802557 RepID=A0A1F8DRL5_9BACT|nr:MAG: hypothetical protein A3A20_00360 [Candidatus Wolfebacteria bacterium RIFCSPLOWO2_01_FULL_45_19]
MVTVSLLNRSSIEEVFKFYAQDVFKDVFYPRDGNWVNNHLDKDIFFICIRIGAVKKLVATAWMARLKNFVYLIIENNRLTMKNDGPYNYSGGWCILPEYRNQGLFRLLTAAVHRYWFDEINKSEETVLWGRMVGQQDIDGQPLFWKAVGESLTGLSYSDLRELPFAEKDREIFLRWPKDPLPFDEIPQAVLQKTLGTVHEPLVGPLKGFIEWGFCELMNRYFPLYLNQFFVINRIGIKDPLFFDRALERTVHLSSNL